MSVRQYLDSTGLQTLVGYLKTYYANASASDTKTKVGYAASAATAAALLNGQKVELTGEATGSVASWDGSSALTIPVTLKSASTTAQGAMSAAHYSKLEAMPAITGITTAEDGLTFTDGVLGVNLTSYAKKSDISTVFNFKGTVANKAALPTTANTGDVYHTIDTHTEYVWVPANAADTAHPEAHWEELGVTVSLDGYATVDYVDTTFVKKSDEIDVSKISGLDDHVKAIKVDAATTADKVAKSLKIKEPGKTSFTEYNGSAEVSIDISNIATSDVVATKADKLTAASNGNILKADTEGNLADTGVSAATLSGGSVAENNPSFVTGGDVYTAIQAQAHDDTTYAFADGEAGTFKVTPSLNGAAQSPITISTGADANIIETIKVKNPGATEASVVAPVEKVVTLDLSTFAIDSDITSIPDATIQALFA